MQKVHRQSGKLNNNTKKNIYILLCSLNLACFVFQLIVYIRFQVFYYTPFLKVLFTFFHCTCTLSITKEYLTLKGGPFWSHKINHKSNIIFSFYLSNQTKGANLYNYYLLWQKISTFSQFLRWFFHHSILNKLNMKKEGQGKVCTLHFLNLLKKPNPFCLSLLKKSWLISFPLPI